MPSDRHVSIVDKCQLDVDVKQDFEKEKKKVHTNMDVLVQYVSPSECFFISVLGTLVIQVVAQRTC